MLDVIKRLPKSNFKWDYNYFSIDNYRVTTDWKLHWHEFYELELVIDGEATQKLNGTTYTLSKGDIYMLTPSDFHEILIKESIPFNVVNVKFSDSFIDEELLDILFASNSSPLASLPIEKYDFFYSELNTIIDEISNKKADSQLFIRNIFQRLLLEFNRSVATQSKPASQQEDIKGFVRKAIIYLNHNFRYNVTLEQVSKYVHVSPNYLSKCFHEATGVPFQNYISELRLAFAKDLIASSELPITEIALAAGFNNLSSFIRAFKELYSVTPGDYRKLCK